MIKIVVSKVDVYRDYGIERLSENIPEEQQTRILPNGNLDRFGGASLFADEETLILSEDPSADRVKDIAEASDRGDVILATKTLSSPLKKLSQTHTVEVYDFSDKRAQVNTRNFIRFYGLNLESSAESMIVSHCGESSKLAVGILRSLEFAYGREAFISQADIQAYLGAPGQKIVWSLTETIDSGNVKQSLSVLNNLLEENSPHSLVGLMKAHYQKMFYIYTTGLSSPTANKTELTKPSYPVIKARKALNRYGVNIIMCYELVSQASDDMKGIKRVPPHLVMEVLVSRLASLAG